MNPITREEYYLAKIAGTWQGETPEPVTAEEYYLAIMAGDYSGNAPQPVTRLQYYMAKAAGVWNGGIPAPVTRLEYYWAAIANGEGEVFAPITREEYFLMLVADAYSVVLTVVSGNPVLLEGAKGDIGLDSLTFYGGSTQGSTTGAQLIKNYEFTLDFIKDNDVNGTKINEELSVGDIFVDGGYLSFVSQETLPFEIQFELHDPDDGNYKTLALFKPQKGFNKTELSGYKFSDTQKRVSLQIRSVLPPLEAISWHISELFVKVGKTGSPWEPYTGGKPSPSPEYPQEIESVGMGEIGISVGGGNLFDLGKCSAISGNFNLNTEIKGDTVRVYGTASGSDNEYASFAILRYQTTELSGKGYFVKVFDAKGTHAIRSTWGLRTEIEKEIAISIDLSKNKNVDITFRVMVSVTEPTAYEPYKPLQTAIIPTPDGLPGIPVSSGGNYTDADGQQWVCDTIEYRRGKTVRVQRVENKVLTGDENMALESTDGYFRVRIEALGSLTTAGRRALLSNRFRMNYRTHDYGTAFSSSGRIYIYPHVEITSIEMFRQWLKENRTTVMYQLNHPIETPLPPEATTQLAALRTYSPTTTVVNDAGAGMSVGYLKKK